MLNVRSTGVFTVHAALAGSGHCSENASNPDHGRLPPFRPPETLDIGAFIDDLLKTFQVTGERSLQLGTQESSHLCRATLDLRLRVDIALEELELALVFRRKLHALLLGLELGEFLSRFDSLR